MRVQPFDGKFIVVRGDSRPQFFCFYVDGNRGAWSKFSEQAQKYTTRDSAEEVVSRLRQLADRRKGER